jgi:5-methylcytosine-specific restriction endonuclease McrA
MTNESITCGICKKKVPLDLKYQFEVNVCSGCAEKIANLYWREHSGHYLTWENPAVKAKPPTKGFSATTKLEVWKRDGFKCVKCNSDSDLSVDHIHPRSKGGSDDMSNLRTLCRTCNSRKAAKLEEAA